MCTYIRWLKKALFPYTVLEPRGSMGACLIRYLPSPSPLQQVVVEVSCKRSESFTSSTKTLSGYLATTLLKRVGSLPSELVSARYPVFPISRERCNLLKRLWPTPTLKFISCMHLDFFRKPPTPPSCISSKTKNSLSHH